jgi:hypothetical protein
MEDICSLEILLPSQISCGPQQELRLPFKAILP